MPWAHANMLGGRHFPAGNSVAIPKPSRKPVVRNRPSFGKRGVRECPARERANSGKPLRFDVSICSQAYLWGLLRHMESAACPRFRHAVRIPSFRGRRFTYAVPSERTHFAPLDVQSGKGP